MIYNLSNDRELYGKYALRITLLLDAFYFEVLRCLSQSLEVIYNAWSRN